MAKQEWAKGRQKCTKTLSIDDDTHELLSSMAKEHRLCLKEMIDVALIAYATYLKESPRSSLKSAGLIQKGISSSGGV